MFDFLPKEFFFIGSAIPMFFLNIWWLWAPYVLFFIFLRIWLIHIRSIFLSKVVWTLLEIKVPSEVGKPPQAMEQVFAGLHGIKSGGNLIDIYWAGKTQLWFSCEIIGRGGAISLFVWTPSQFRNLVEAQVYAQYPESEIREVSDYTEDLPKNIPNEEWSLGGFELMLNKEDAYPIRTYKAFVMEKIEEESQKVDPLASLAEVLSKLKTGEEIWIQMLIRPSGNEWKEKGTELVNKLLGRKKPSKKSFATEIGDSISSYFVIATNALFGTPINQSIKKDEKKDSKPELSPGERDVVKAVEENISKLGFDTAIRILYLAKRDVFQPANMAALFGAFNQFNDLRLNGFKRANGTGVDYFFVSQRELRLKRSLVMKYRMREKPGPAYSFSLFDNFYALFDSYTNSQFVFNIEELATVFHIPGGVVTTVSLARIEAKRSAPPINLPLG